MVHMCRFRGIMDGHLCRIGYTDAMSSSSPLTPSSPDGSSWPRLGASAALWRGDEVLLVQRAFAPLAGYWSLPGGHVDPGETIEHAARRELHEETGAEAGPLHFVGMREVIKYKPDGALSVHFLLAVYTGAYVGGTIAAADDAADALWRPYQDLGDLLTLDGVDAAIQAAHQVFHDPAHRAFGYIAHA